MTTPREPPAVLCEAARIAKREYAGATMKAVARMYEDLETVLGSDAVSASAKRTYATASVKAIVAAYEEVEEYNRQDFGPSGREAP